MEATLPPFAAAKPKSTSAPSLAGFQAASVRLPLCFMLVGVLSLLGTAGCLLAQPDLLATYHYTPHMIAVTHLFVLGFISSIVMGAMYQLVPVTLEVHLYSERLVKWQFVAHSIGFIGMVLAFWNSDMARVGQFGSILTLGVGLFVYNLSLTLAGVDGWNAIKFGIASALFWLSFTVVVGLFLAASKCWTFSPFMPLAAMHAHAHLGGVGIFAMMIVTVSYKLVPMFTLSELQNDHRAWWSIAILNFGLLGAFIAILLQSPLKLAFAFIIASGFVLYGLEIRAILRSRNRRKLDWGMKYFLTALSLLVPLSLLAFVLAWPELPVNMFTMQLENVYGLLALLGLVGLAILGMLYKIVPFLVWFHSYSRQIGRAKVPTLTEMYSVPLQVAGYWTFLAGLAVTSVATACSQETIIRWGGGLLALSLALFAVNMGNILAHFVRPRIEPLVSKELSGGKTL